MTTSTDTKGNLSKRESALQGDDSTFLAKRISDGFRMVNRVELPPFPKQIQVETTNICNHGCSFCAYTEMKRTKKHMDKDMFKRVVKEAYDLGAREIGLFSGAEPLTCKWIDEYTRYAHEIGYEYSYISTNGVLGGQTRLQRVMDAGIRSIKFSVNGGTRESYLTVHGKDDFDAVIANIRFASAYREKLPWPVFLAVSFVECEDSRGTLDSLRAEVGDCVDEIMNYIATPPPSKSPYGAPLASFHDCPLPFSKAHISVEGYLRVCCNDYENLLALVDLRTTSLEEAWKSDIFRDIRRRHLEDRLAGTACGKCIRGDETPVQPLNAELSPAS